MNLGETLKRERQLRNETLHRVSMETDIDVTLLSKFERNLRFPTNLQIDKLALHFHISADDLKSLVISNKIIKEFGINDVTEKAIHLVKDQIVTYFVTSKKKKI